VLIEARDGVPVRVRDVARVRLAPMMRQGAVTRDGRGEVVTGIVMMLVGANGREVVEREGPHPGDRAVAPARRAHRRLLRPRRARPAHHQHRRKNLAEGALFVVAVLFLLLGSLRGGLIVAAAIPFAMLVAFTGMKALGLSGNLMSLGAIDFGIVVDGSIIVVESAVVHLAAAAKGRTRPSPTARPPTWCSTPRSTCAARRSFGEAIIVLVYVPILTLAGVEGKMFKPMAITVLFALARRVRRIAHLRAGAGRVAPAAKPEEHEPFVVRLLHRVYPRLLPRGDGRAEARDRASALVLLAVAGSSGRAWGRSSSRRLDEGAMAIQIMRLPSVSLEESVRGATRFERVLREFPEVISVVPRPAARRSRPTPWGSSSRTSS
jgi:cobalt-zinc-cadmium resistance protein CzcA